MTIDEKIEEIEFEINMRRKVYTRKVNQHKMRKPVARRKLDIMKEIRQDYLKAKQLNEGTLTELFKNDRDE